MRVLFSAADIAARVDTLAGEIAHALPADFVMVGLLKGVWVFVADLGRALDRAGSRPEIEFVRLASYGLAKQSSGSVRLLGDIPPVLAGRPVLLVDDIVDTGRSIAYATTQLRRREVQDLWTCALLDKPRRREIEARSISLASRSATRSWLLTAPTTPRNIATCRISGLWSDAPHSPSTCESDRTQVSVVNPAVRPGPCYRSFGMWCPHASCLSGGGSAGGITRVPYISCVRQHPCARFPQREQ